MKIRALALLMLVCSIPLSACNKNDMVLSPKREITTYEERVIPVKRLSALNITVDSSNIQVYSWDEDKVKFEMLKKIRGIDDPKQQEKEFENFKVSINKEAENISFTSKYKGSIKNPADRSVDLKIYIPKRIEALNCKLDIGTVKFFDDLKCDFNADIKTANTDINKFEGRINYNGDMSNLRIQEGKVKGESSIKVNFGNIDIKAAFETGKCYDFQTGLGNIDLKLPSDSQVRIDTVGNLIENAFSSSISETKIILNSGMGKIKINKF